MRESQLNGRARLSDLKGEHAMADTEMRQQRCRFDRLADPQSATRHVSSFNLFQTPMEIADMMAMELGTRRRVLEPSAGLGRLYRAALIRCGDFDGVLVDVSEDCCRELRLIAKAGDRVVNRDFLAMTDLGQFDGIIMNPPFKMGTDVKHILHAHSMLEHGGRLVSLCACGPRQIKSIQSIATTWRVLPSNSFRSEATAVEVAMVVIDK